MVQVIENNFFETIVPHSVVPCRIYSLKKLRGTNLFIGNFSKFVMQKVILVQNDLLKTL